MPYYTRTFSFDIPAPPSLPSRPANILCRKPLLAAGSWQSPESRPVSSSRPVEEEGKSSASSALGMLLVQASRSAETSAPGNYQTKATVRGGNGFRNYLGCGLEREAKLSLSPRLASPRVWVYGSLDLPRFSPRGKNVMGTPTREEVRRYPGDGEARRCADGRTIQERLGRRDSGDLGALGGGDGNHRRIPLLARGYCAASCASAAGSCWRGVRFEYDYQEPATTSIAIQGRLEKPPTRQRAAVRLAQTFDQQMGGSGSGSGLDFGLDSALGSGVQEACSSQKTPIALPGSGG
ncbi:hypothetical protein JHW43_001635 [Diplocarpon mali]|nr:hypothetical protein JHW43_001635 [Diplocarpon mali]